jgi:hypothetical protein
MSKQKNEYEINAATVEKDGSFKCPKCKTRISPDDETEENYQILETKMANDELLELVLSCNKCGSTIKLVEPPQMDGAQ